MARYRVHLPQEGGDLFLTDGGIETTLIFLEGIELPNFAAFDLLKSEAGRETLRRYFQTHASLARKHDTGFILESATWRASLDWGAKMGYSREALADANREAVEMLVELRAELENGKPFVVSGCIGPRGDAYRPASRMSEDEAQAYHSFQAALFAETDADMVTAITMTYAEEAIGIARAAQAAAMPVAIAFTTETDGRLPSGQTLPDAIEQVDRATDHAPAYYMINCAHPTHFENALAAGEAWTSRIRGVRANASRMSHAELDEATALDAGNPDELATQYRELRAAHPQLNVLGGCCGTDHRHIDAIGRACSKPG